MAVMDRPLCQHSPRCLEPVKWFAMLTDSQGETHTLVMCNTHKIDTELNHPEVQAVFSPTSPVGG